MRKLSEPENAGHSKRRGRPATGKRGTFSFRVTASLRAKLEAEAKEHGLPVSEVIERRLDQSYRDGEMEAVIRRVIREETSNASA